MLCVTEHWILNSNINHVVVPNFKFASYFARSNCTHGGSLICVRSKSNLNFNEISTFKKLSVECHIEMCGISVKLEENDKVVIFCVYRPPNGDLKIFFSRLTSALNFVTKNKYRYTILCGDLNINLLDRCLHTKLLCDIFESFQLNVTTNEPTRVVQNVNGHTSSSALDYLVTNLPSSNYKVQVYDALLADHLAHLFSFSVSLENKREKVFGLKRIINEGNICEFSMRLLNNNWDYLVSLDARDAFNNFLSDVQWGFDVACPLKRVEYQSHKKTENSWITDKIIRDGQALKNLHNNLKNNPNVINVTTYKNLKRQHKKNIKTAKQTFYNNKINDAENRSRETWKIVNQRLGKTDNLRKPIQLNIGDRLISDNVEIANHFATHFVTVAPNNILNHFGYNLSLPHTVSANIEKSLFFYEVTKSELFEIVNKLKNKTSSGLDGLTAYVIKNIILNIADPLLYCINKAIINGYFPDALKISSVSPIFKKGCETDIDNYRQISVLSVVSKMIEQIISNRIILFLDKYNVLTNSQHGFRKDRSTESAAAKMFEHVYRELDKGRYVVSIFFDLSKAFDSVNKDILISKLDAIGIRGNILNCLISYMQDRSLTVKYNEVQSNRFDINLGVPQGSVLGPLLFLIYINELPMFIENGYTIMYADDTTVTVSAGNPDELYNKVQIVRNEMITWCDRNKLILNVNKTVFMNFNLRRPVVLPGITLSNCSKFLGLLVDSNLTWEEHINHVCSKLNQAYFALLQLKESLNESGLVNVYYALAYSHLSLNIFIWGRSYHVSRVFILQKRLIRLLFNLNFRESCRTTFINKKLLTVPSIYIYKCLLYVKKNLESFEGLTDHHLYSTRNKNILSIPLHRTSTFKDSLQYNCIVLYNKLPGNVQSMTLPKYKNTVKNILLENGYYNIDEYLTQELL